MSLQVLDKPIHCKIYDMGEKTGDMVNYSRCKKKYCR